MELYCLAQTWPHTWTPESVKVQRPRVCEAGTNTPGYENAESVLPLVLLVEGACKATATAVLQ